MRSTDCRSFTITMAKRLYPVILAYAIMQPLAAFAQDEAGTQSGDIVVTAQRRPERLQDVPIAMTALNGDSLEDRNVTNLEDLVGRFPACRLPTPAASPRPT